MFSRMVLAVVMVILVTIASARADSLDFLMNDSLSMMDWGLSKANETLGEAVKRLNSEIDRHFEHELNVIARKIPQDSKFSSWYKQQNFKGRYGVWFTNFDFDARRIDLTAYVYAEDLTRIHCLLLAEDLRNMITLSNINYDGRQLSAESAEDIKVLLRRWFSHSGFSRYPKLDYDDLLLRVYVVIKLSRSMSEPPTVVCRQTLLGR